MNISNRDPIQRTCIERMNMLFKANKAVHTCYNIGIDSIEFNCIDAIPGNEKGTKKDN